MPDYAQLRHLMVEAQVRTNDVTDPRIHAAMREVAREHFVPGNRRALAYADVPVEVAPQRYLLDPRSFAKLVQLAQIEPGDRVLDVGTATGYSAAVLAKLAKSVVALEQDADLVRIASESLDAAGARNVAVVQGALTDGARAQGPYNVIIINGAISIEPTALFEQLAEGGRLVAVLMEGVQGHAYLFLKEKGQVGRHDAFDAAVPELAGYKRVVGFVF
jgi:protein-L-isoaspartate(D-aspartate) O-methyltransferase